MERYSSLVLRIGIGAVIIWFALQQLTDPSAWVSYLPSWTQSLPVSQIGFVYLNAWFEITFGTLMILGFYTRIVAGLLALHMIGIVFSIGYSPTGLRDFAIFIALTSISLQGTSTWSLDEIFEKNSSKNAIT